MQNMQNSGRLLAGAARVDITPPAGIAMCGYGERTLGAEGIHDPLFARVVVLRAGGASLALVAADLVYLYSSRIVAEVRHTWNIDHVLLCGSHTHSGPVLYPGAWYSSMEDKVIAAVGEAATNLFPARIGTGAGPVLGDCFGYNRRVVGRDGQVTMLWGNPDRKPVGPTDPTVRIIRIDDDGGNPRVVMVNFACHPVTLGSGNRMISADFPGPMVERIESELGDSCMAMFLQGAGGGCSPL